MSAYQIEEKKDRRRRDDVWIRFTGVLGGVGWLLIFGASYLIARAKPKFGTVFGWKLDMSARQYWLISTARLAFICLALAFCLGVAGLLINRKRRRRKKDFYRISLIMLSVVSFLGMSAYLYYFGGY